MTRAMTMEQRILLSRRLTLPPEARPNDPPLPPVYTGPDFRLFEPPPPPPRALKAILLVLLLVALACALTGCGALGPRVKKVRSVDRVYETHDSLTGLWAQPMLRLTAEDGSRCLIQDSPTARGVAEGVEVECEWIP